MLVQIFWSPSGTIHSMCKPIFEVLYITKYNSYLLKDEMMFCSVFTGHLIKLTGFVLTKLWYTLL